MKLAQGIKKHGFRKWYERQLLQSHAHLALVFLMAVGLFAAMEAAVKFKSWQDQLLDAVAVLMCFAVGLWALRRYLFLLSHAETMAGQATCPHCDAYGSLEVMQDDTAREQSLQVRCKRCAHTWTMHAVDGT